MNASRSYRSRTLMPTACLLIVGFVALGNSGCAWVSHSDNVAGVGYFDQGNYAAAITKFQRAIEADPNDADSYYNLAATYHRQGKIGNQQPMLQQAETYYHLCLDRNPDHRDCYRGLAVLLVEENRADDAFSLVQRWSEHSPSSPDPKIELARLFQEFGDKNAAQAHLQDALSVAPDNPRARSGARQVEGRTGRSDAGLGRLSAVVGQQSLPAGSRSPRGHIASRDSRRGAHRPRRHAARHDANRATA